MQKPLGVVLPRMPEALFELPVCRVWVVRFVAVAVDDRPEAERCEQGQYRLGQREGSEHHQHGTRVYSKGFAVEIRCDSA